MSNKSIFYNNESSNIILGELDNALKFVLLSNFQILGDTAHRNKKLFGVISISF